jgi:N-acetylglucosaminyldiphosphoundecaprenol N-acetyl-beta-D-mannosaminyltransferase
MLQFIDSADLVVPDGIGIVLAARLLWGVRLRRVAGADLMQAICEVAPARGYRVFLYGSSPDANRRAAETLQARHPGITIAGREHGYLSACEMEHLVLKINQADADILFVGLGSPRQELWIQENLTHLNVKVIQGIGGTLDTIAGTVRRAPRWMRESGLEWLFRLTRQPWRARRHLRLARFMTEVVAEKMYLGRARQLRSGS